MNAQFLFVVVVLGSVAVSAQTSPVTGLVQSEDGQTVTGSTVRVQTTTVSATTNASGVFEILGLPEGQAVSLTASAPGFFIGGPVVTASGHSTRITLKRLPEHDNAAYQWLSPYAASGHQDNCENCHARSGSEGPRLPYDEWIEDAHGRAALNPRFISMYRGTDLAGKNQSPPTRFEASADYGRTALRPDPSVPYFGPGYLLDFPGTAGNCAACHAPVAWLSAPFSARPDQPGSPGTEGISCDFCHKISGVLTDPASGHPYANMSGALSYTLLRPALGEQLFFGPLDDVAPRHDAYSPLHKESRFCAGCHSGSFWGVQVYNSFGEWLESPYSTGTDAKTCQDCHMPSRGQNMFALVAKGGRVRSPETIRSHLMRGPGDTAFLASAAQLELEANQDNGTLKVVAKVTNAGAGHFLPTDHPARNLLLIISVVDGLGNELKFLNGSVVPDWGGLGNSPEDYGGQPGKGFARILQEVWTGVAPTAAYWNPIIVQSDTRIPPLQTDASVYEYEVTGLESIRVVARLIYRRAFRDLANAKRWDDPDVIMQEQHLTLKKEESPP